MFYIKAPFRFLYKLYFGIVFFGLLLVQFPLYFVLTRKASWAPGVIWLKRYFWSPALQLLLLVWIKVEGKEKLKKGGTYVYTPNHSSYHDIIFAYAYVSGTALFIGKNELKRWPLLQVFFRNGNSDIAIDRQRAREAAKALLLARKRLNEGYGLIIFPEGTIPNNAPVLNEFKNGAFKLAIDNQTPVVPITYLDNWQLMSDPAKLFGPCRPGISRILIHDPIETRGMTEKDILSLQQQAHGMVEADLKKYVYPKLRQNGRQ